MNRREELDIVIAELVEAYVDLYQGVTRAGIIQDEVARVRATNGLMVELGRSVGFRIPMDAKAEDFSTPRVPDMRTPAGNPVPEKPLSAPNAPPTPAKEQKPQESPAKGQGSDAPKGEYYEGAYDEKMKMWIHCPHCGSNEIQQRSKKGGKYQGCFDCHVFLNPDGSEKAMKPSQGGG